MLGKQNIASSTHRVFIALFCLTLMLPLSRSGAKEIHKEISAAKVPGLKLIDEKTESDKLISIVEKWTDIATKNRLNADFVPGMVTVLYGKELEALGMRTVWEALTLVPGIDISIERQGFLQTHVRGTASVYSSVNSKILLDGIPLITAIGLTPVVNMQIEQVERIEVIRGPGSAVHGEFALLGVVNIITHKEPNKVFSTLGRYNTYGGGGIFSWSAPERDVKVDLNLAGWKTKGASVETGPDTLYGMGMGAISNAPGPINDKVNYGAGLFNLHHDDFSFSIHWMQSGQGDFFGIGYALPPQEDRLIFQQQQWGLMGTRHMDPSPSLHIDFNIGWQEQNFKGNEGYFYPPGLTTSDPNGTVIQYPDGWIYGFNYKERMLHAGMDFNWKEWHRHKFLLGWSFFRTDFLDAWLEANIELDSLLPSDQPIRSYADKENRIIFSMSLQDELRVSDQFTFTANLRFDHYNDIGVRFSPRMAAVYRPAKRHLLKTQYAKAFRPPTFCEMYAPTNPLVLGNLDLEPETIDTYELGYIYKGIYTVWRITSFYSRLKDRMFEDTGLHLQKNAEEEMHFTGAEFELERQICSFLKLDANLSYVDIENQGASLQMAQAANWLSNVGLRYQALSNCNLTAQYRYVGDRKREPLDPRDDMDGYHTVDIVGNLFDIGVKGFTLRAGIKNVFDEDVRYPAPVERYWPIGGPCPTYPDDLPRPGRQWWGQLSYSF